MEDTLDTEIAQATSAWDPAQMFPLVGDGPLPARLDRANWGAMLLGIIWLAYYGIWGHFAVVAIASLAQGRILLALSSAWIDYPWRVTAFEVGYRATLWTYFAWLGLNANRLVWTKQQRRLAEAGTRRIVPLPEWRFDGAQRRWAIAGLVYLLASALLDLMWFGIDAPSTAAGLGNIAVTAIALLYVYLVDRSHRSAIGTQS